MHTTDIQSTVTPEIRLVVVTEDASGNEVRKTWRLVFDYRAIAKAEAAIGRDIKKIAAWKDISSGKDFPAIVHAGLNRYNPEVTLDEVLDVLNPMAQTALSDEIFYYMFPGMREALAKAAEAESGAENPQKATLNS
jgi:hypothetical protein